jgi:hypothetical protein
MSALPIILKQHSVSVGLFTRIRERELGQPRPNGREDSLRPPSSSGGLVGVQQPTAQPGAWECVKLREHPKGWSTKGAPRGGKTGALTPSRGELPAPGRVNDPGYGNNDQYVPMGYPQPSLTPAP